MSDKKITWPYYPEEIAEELTLEDVLKEGQKFGLLTVVAKVKEKYTGKRTVYIVRCICGRYEMRGLRSLHKQQRSRKKICATCNAQKKKRRTRIKKRRTYQKRKRKEQRNRRYKNKP